MDGKVTEGTNPSQHKILTIPNLMSLFRLLLIPFIAYSYVVLENTVLSIVLVAVSGLSDVLDGKVARRFNMVSDFGKFFDPLADKLTQICLILAICFRNRVMIPIFAFLVVKELFMLITGYIVIKKTGGPDQAKWYGKACTVVIYSVIIIMFIFPEMPLWLSYTLAGITFVFMMISVVMYAINRAEAIKNASLNKNKENGEITDEKCTADL